LKAFAIILAIKEESLERSFSVLHDQLARGKLILRPIVNLQYVWLQIKVFVSSWMTAQLDELEVSLMMHDDRLDVICMVCKKFQGRFDSFPFNSFHVFTSLKYKLVFISGKSKIQIGFHFGQT